MHFHRFDEPGKVKLDKISEEPPPNVTKQEARDRLEKIGEELFELQGWMWGAHTHSVLLVLQGRDAAGKDGAVKHMSGALNPRGVAVTSFGVPTQEEREHDFLWRVHKPAPRAGRFAIFNRSHYEDVLVVRVHELVPKSQWSKRYDQINAFEHELADNGTRIVKFFLHISKAEQKKRILERLEDPRKRWKFSPSDLEERKRWDDYMAAYQEAIRRCNTPWAPWFVIPANRNWYRNAVVSQIVLETLEDMKPKLPAPKLDVREDMID